MKKRILSGIICALLLIAVMFLSTIWPFSLNLSVALVSFFSVYEIINLKKESKLNFLSVISYIFSIIRPIIGPGVKWHLAIYIYTIACFIISMERFIKNKKRMPEEQKSVWNVCFIFFLNIIISVALSTIVEIRNFGKNFGIFLSLLSLGIAWSCDIGAYFFGKKFGKNKLCPYVSPKKTVEGAIGGIISSFIYVFLFCFSWQYIFKIYNIIYNINYLTVAGLAILGGPIAILGDLCFSLIKRLLSVKDFGEIIPGHGGVLDRFDSVIFVSPFVFIFLHIFDILG